MVTVVLVGFDDDCLGGIDDENGNN